MRLLRSDLPLITAGSTGYFFAVAHRDHDVFGGHIFVRCDCFARLFQPVAVIYGCNIDGTNSLPADPLPDSGDRSDDRVAHVIDFFRSLPGVEKAEAVS